MNGDNMDCVPINFEIDLRARPNSQMFTDFLRDGDLTFCSDLHLCLLNITGKSITLFLMNITISLLTFKLPTFEFLSATQCVAELNRGLEAPGVLPERPVRAVGISGRRDSVHNRPWPGVPPSNHENEMPGFKGPGGLGFKE
jgi:hypothetical protein